MPRTYPLPKPASNKKAAPVKEIKSDAPEDMHKLDKSGLEKRAAELGLDLSACKNNAERADAIIAALEKENGE